jgi:tetratricopeptide (TPR) repeat protein
MCKSMRYITITMLMLCGLLAGCGKGSQASNPRLQAALDKLAAAKSPELKFRALGDAARQSVAAGKVEDARKYAQELVALLPEFRQDSEYGNAVHDANLTLGRIAVREGRMDEAKSCLIQSISVPGARLMDYGPSMGLAKDLLEKGERQAVLEYFVLCKKFWNNSRLDDWSQQVSTGQIPDFGAARLF